MMIEMKSNLDQVLEALTKHAEKFKNIQNSDSASEVLNAELEFTTEVTFPLIDAYIQSSREHINAGTEIDYAKFNFVHTFYDFVENSISSYELALRRRQYDEEWKQIKEKEHSTAHEKEPKPS